MWFWVLWELVRLVQKPCFNWDDGDDKAPFILDNIMMTPSSHHYHRCWVLSLGDGGNRRQVKNKIRETALSHHIQAAEKYSAVKSYVFRQAAPSHSFALTFSCRSSVKTKISLVMIHHKLFSSWLALLGPYNLTSHNSRMWAEMKMMGLITKFSDCNKSLRDGPPSFFLFGFAFPQPSGN